MSCLCLEKTRVQKLKIIEVKLNPDAKKTNDEEFFLCSRSDDFCQLKMKKNTSDGTDLIEKEPIEDEKKVKKSIVDETFDSKSIMDRATKQQKFLHQIQVRFQILLKKTALKNRTTYTANKRKML